MRERANHLAAAHTLLMDDAKWLTRSLLRDDPTFSGILHLSELRPLAALFGTVIYA